MADDPIRALLNEHAERKAGSDVARISASDLDRAASGANLELVAVEGWISDNGGSRVQGPPIYSDSIYAGRRTATDYVQPEAAWKIPLAALVD
jgi:hypothetical protein